MSQHVEKMMSPSVKQASAIARRAALASAAMALLAASTLWAQPPGPPPGGPPAGGPPGAAPPGAPPGVFPGGGAPGGFPGGPAGGPPASARVQAPIDLTGYWVSLVTEDWRYRMLVPGKGELMGLPISPEAKQISDAYDPAADTAAGKQCKAYGAAVLMRNPERLHISWQDDSTLQVDTDAGMQTRLLHFSPTPPQPASWQGDSQAQWSMGRPAFGPPPGGAGGRRGAGGGPRPGGPGGPPGGPNAAPRWGTLHVMTRNMLAGLLRKNGVPYSDRTTLEEWWEINQAPNTGKYLTITSIVADPVYLRGTYTTTEIFAPEADGSKWSPTPCSLTSVP